MREYYTEGEEEIINLILKHISRFKFNDDVTEIDKVNNFLKRLSKLIEMNYERE